MTIRDFALPDLGEGLTESELVSWRVAIGDTIELNQIIAEVETAKALVELPSPFAGVVSKFYAEAGTTVAVGAPIVAVEVADAATAGLEATAPDAPARAAERTSERTDAAPIEREPVLVGYGPPVEGGARPHRRSRSPLAGQALSDGDTVPGVGEPAVSTSDAPSPDAPSSDMPSSDMTSPDAPTPDRTGAAVHSPRSTPPVRALARELGVDLAAVAGTGDGGLVTRDDVRAFAATSGLDSVATREAEHVAPAPTARETRTPITGVRKHTANAMVASAFTAPHVTEFLTVDVSAAVELLARLRADRSFADQRLTMLTIVAKAVCIAVRRTSAVNTRWDDDAQEIVQFHYVNLGIAAATPRGLMVPNVKDADGLSFVDLAMALTALVETAKAGRSGSSELSGGTITITNIGVFGIDAGTPILNPGEAAILAMGAVRRMPWEHHGDVALRDVMTLSLSFDHRLVDGEQGSRFLADVGTILSDPGTLLTMV